MAEYHELPVLLNAEEVVQFRQALAEYVESCQQMPELVADLSGILGNLYKTMETQNANARIIINLMSGWGEFGNRTPLNRNDSDEIVKSIFSIQEGKDPDDDPGDIAIDIQDDSILVSVFQNGEILGWGNSIQGALEDALRKVQEDG